MTDKVQKIKDWISKEQEGLMDAKGNFEYPKHQGAYNVLCNLDAYIDSLQEEPVSKDFEKALAEMVDKAQTSVVEPLVVAAQWKDYLIELAKSEEPVSEQNLSNVERTVKEWKEPVSEELEEAAKNVGQKYFPDEYNIWARPNYEAVKVECAFKDGAKWKKQQIWKPADGDDLPILDREVIVLCKNGRVAFGHRPVEKFKARPIGHGRTEEYEVKTYDKGGWNIPDVKYWLDVELPKEIEL